MRIPVRCNEKLTLLRYKNSCVEAIKPSQEKTNITIALWTLGP